VREREFDVEEGVRAQAALLVGIKRENWIRVIECSSLSQGNWPTVRCLSLLIGYLVAMRSLSQDIQRQSGS